MHETHTPHHANPKIRALFPELDEPDQIYAAVVYHADVRIGRLLKRLDELKLTKNTLVVFSSDNGPARAGKTGKVEISYDTASGPGYNVQASKGITGGRRMYKASLFEGGINVPFIARWPGKIEAGKVDNVSMISAVDLLPTFCEVAGVKLPKSYQGDGVSQLKALMGKKTEGRAKPLYWKKNASPSSGKKKDGWPAFATVHQNWKLVMSADGKTLELFDILKDPYEKSNLADKNPEVVKRLTKSVMEWNDSLPAKADSTCFSSYRGKPSVKETFKPFK